MYRSHVLVCGGTGCTSSHSAEIIAEFEKEIAEKGLADEIKVIRTGCFGLCALGPIVVVYPEGAFYIFPEVSAYFGKKYGDKTINDANDLAMYLLETGHVATVGGDAFCAPGYIRLSYATSDDNIRKAVARIADALKMLK